MTHNGFKIDLSESFEHLPGAPIVEAVIDWRARAERKLEPDSLFEQLRARLPDYRIAQRQQDISVDAEFGPEATAVLQQRHWHGFRFQTADKLHVAQFTHNGFVFSRLEPYDNWARFAAEANRLWQMYCELAVPSEVQRLGVRFINRFGPVDPNRLSDLLSMPPPVPDGMPLPLKGFVHQGTFDIPSYPYNLTVRQTIQPSPPAEIHSDGLILDFDVFTTQPTQLAEVDHRLRQMQWIKNKAFFSCVTEEALERFRRPKL